MRSKKQTLEEQTVVDERCPQFCPHTWSCQAIRSKLYEILAANDITACGRKSSARILDQGAGHDVGACLRRLKRFHELAVAVVNEANTVGSETMDLMANFSNIFDEQCRASAVAA